MTKLLKTNYDDQLDCYWLDKMLISNSIVGQFDREMTDCLGVSVIKHPKTTDTLTTTTTYHKDPALMQIDSYDNVATNFIVDDWTIVKNELKVCKGNWDELHKISTNLDDEYKKSEDLCTRSSKCEFSIITGK